MVCQDKKVLQVAKFVDLLHLNEINSANFQIWRCISWSGGDLQGGPMPFQYFFYLGTLFLTTDLERGK